ncbi:acyltransferase 3 [Aspergillus ambiguus]|uniref:acyltransferase family protein n=1 Tax=Aspergillus ambiguus TaxID=176160 RepID=UPI003CCE358B
MDRTTWLDGLRGIAAAIVAFDHYFMGGVLDVAFRSYWADPKNENSRIIQLFPLRIFFAAHAMVPLFFVISGFALSIGLIRARDSPDTTTNHRSDFLRRLSSAATRRPFRIYLPVFIIATTSQVLYFCNLYSWSFGDEVVWGRRPWRAPMLHLSYLIRYLLDITNCIQFHGNPGLNGQLWTMPLEFRGSIVIYLTILALAFWRPGFRRGALVGMMTYFFYYGLWDIFGFLAGLYLAESKDLSSETDCVYEWKLPSRISSWAGRVKPINFNKAWTIFCFVFGLYLICLSDDGYLPPGYQFLKHVQSSRWDDDWAVLSKSWKSMGSFMLVYAISKSEFLQSPLDSKIVQYLGKISFSLYLVHQSVYHLGREPLLKFFWLVLRQEPYPGTEDAKTHSLAFGVSWLGTFLAMAVILIYLADVYTRFVDIRCVQLARRIERWATR